MKKKLKNIGIKVTNKNGNKASKTNLYRLNNLLTKPDSNRVLQNNEKSLALKIMSLDLNTTEFI